MSKPIRIVCVLWLLVSGFSWLQADGRVVLKLRLYQGVRDSNAAGKGKMDDFTLRKIAYSRILTDSEARKEQKSIIKIYSLNYVHILYQLCMVMQKGALVDTKKALALNKRDIRLRIEYPSGDRELFKVEILPLEKQRKPLLSSEIFIPAGKTAVLGFEDSEGKVFFLAVQRVGSDGAKEKKAPGTVEFPKLISRSKPAYPPDALARGISGLVILECHTDLRGQVNETYVLEGPEELIPASRESALKWRYSPWKINGKPEPLRMHLMIFYKIIENSGKSIDTSEKAISETLDRYRPLMKQWKVSHPVSPENKAILEIIIVQGKK